jgi:hypothetical protein
VYDISGSYGSDYEDDSLLGYCTVYSRRSRLTFREYLSQKAFLFHWEFFRRIFRPNSKREKQKSEENFITSSFIFVIFSKQYQGYQIEKGEIGMAYSMHREVRNAHKILVGNMNGRYVIHAKIRTKQRVN